MDELNYMNSSLNTKELQLRRQIFDLIGDDQEINPGSEKDLYELSDEGYNTEIDDNDRVEKRDVAAVSQNIDADLYDLSDDDK